MKILRSIILVGLLSTIVPCHGINIQHSAIGQWWNCLSNKEKLANGALGLTAIIGIIIIGRLVFRDKKTNPNLNRLLAEKTSINKKMAGSEALLAELKARKDAVEKALDTKSKAGENELCAECRAHQESGVEQTPVGLSLDEEYAS
jgi:hypothetical protein